MKNKSVHSTTSATTTKFVPNEAKKQALESLYMKKTVETPVVASSNKSGSETLETQLKNTQLQVDFLTKENSEQFTKLKTLGSDYRKLELSHNEEINKRVELNAKISQLEKELQESLDLIEKHKAYNRELTLENEKLKDTLKTTDYQLKQKEKYIDLLVLNNNGVLSNDELRLNESLKREADKRNSVKRNSVAVGKSNI